MSKDWNKIRRYLDNPSADPASLISDIPQGDLEEYMYDDWQSRDLCPDKPMTHLFPVIKHHIKKHQSAKTFSIIRYSLATAASLTILLVTSFFWLTSKKTISTEYAIAEIRLSDGSRVTLHQNSQLTYPRYFIGNTRDVYLEGTGFFEVTRNEEKSFIVKQEYLSTRVLGTSFIVSFLDSIASVKVISGKVGVTAQATGEKVHLLEANQKINFKVSTNELSIDPDFSPNDLSWKTGIIKFENTPIDLVAQDIYATYQKEITYSEDLKSLNVTAIFEKQSFTEIVKELSLILNADVAFKNNKAYFYKK